METLSLKQKRKMLSDFFILSYKLGYAFDDYIGKPLSYFNFTEDGIIAVISRMNDENIAENDHYFFMDAPIYQSNFTTILKTEY